MSRPTKEDLEEAEWQEIGRKGCLIPDDDSSSSSSDADEGDDEADE